MPRRARSIVAGYCYHVMNRANDKARIFHDHSDYAAFVGFMAEAQKRFTLGMLATCLMPNHVHFVLMPSQDDQISKWAHWLFTNHAARHHRKYETVGRLWQNRFKASAIQQDGHLLRVMRYVERNASRAGMVSFAEDWPWSSLNWRIRSHPLVTPHPSPVALPDNWMTFVNKPQSEAELSDLRNAIRRQSPIGNKAWVATTARALGVAFSIRPRGRPRETRAEFPSTMPLGFQPE
jgi:putative transposase